MESIFITEDDKMTTNIYREIYIANKNLKSLLSQVEKSIGVMSVSLNTEGPSYEDKERQIFYEISCIKQTIEEFKE
jgi:hypothetical protein